MIDLDYDNDLAHDAEALGQSKIAQGDAIPLTPQQSPDTAQMPQTGDLKRALYVAREVYGETNSPHSELFCHWVQDVLEGRADERGTKEMLELLHGDKESFGCRVGWKTLMDGHTETVVRLRARREAAICAMNVVRAVLNKLRGREYEQWIVRSFWRASKTERDVKCLE